MFKPLLTCLVLLLFGNVLSAAAIPAEFVFTVNQERYIKRYKDIAIREMERSGVPASIKLAQGILESDSGNSSLARSANNHFGIKCGSQWKGEEYYKKDDDYNDQGQLIKSCFRKYRNPDASFVAHSAAGPKAYAGQATPPTHVTPSCSSASLNATTYNSTTRLAPLIP